MKPPFFFARSPLASQGPLLLAGLLILFLIGCSGSSGGLIPGLNKMPDRGVVRVNGVNFRIAPTTLATKVQVLNRGEELEIVKRSKEKVRIGKNEDYWYLARLQNGVEGWVFGTSLSFNGLVESSKKKIDPEVIRKSIVGKWWEMREDGSTGYARIYFWPDGVYKYGRAGRDMKEGHYEIRKDEGMVHLDHGSPAGERIRLYKIRDEFRLKGKKGGVLIYFKKADENPDDPEGEEIETSDESGGSAGSAAAPATNQSSTGEAAPPQPSGESTGQTTASPMPGPATSEGVNEENGHE